MPRYEPVIISRLSAGGPCGKLTANIHSLNALFLTNYSIAPYFTCVSDAVRTQQAMTDGQNQADAKRDGNAFAIDLVQKVAVLLRESKAQESHDEQDCPPVIPRCLCGILNTAPNTVPLCPWKF